MNRLVLAIIAVVFIIGLAMLMSSYHPSGWNQGAFFLIGFVFAGRSERTWPGASCVLDVISRMHARDTMEGTMKLQPYSSKVLALCGIILMGMGLYFAFFHPPLLSEDVRYIGASFAKIQENVPYLLNWLNKVFWVMGAYMFTSGVLTLYTAATSFRKRARGAAAVMALAGFTSLGWMTIVDFMLGSDFKWLLLVFALLWAWASVLFWLGK